MKRIKTINIYPLMKFFGFMFYFYGIAMIISGLFNYNPAVFAWAYVLGTPLAWLIKLSFILIGMYSWAIARYKED